MREMPTGAKLVGAICFAVVTLIAGLAYWPLMTDAPRNPAFLPIAALFGAMVGWFHVGRLAGRGLRSAVISGVAGSLWITIWSTLAFSLYEMFRRSLEKRYPMPDDALNGAVRIGIDYLSHAADPTILTILLVGGVIGGVLTESAARRWS